MTSPAYRTDFRFTPPKILCHPYNLMANGSYRQMQAAKAALDAGFATIRVDDYTVSSDVLQIMRPDVVLFPTMFEDRDLTTIERYRRVVPEAFLAYDIDDRLWEVPAHSPAAAALPKDMKRRLQKPISLVDRVVVSTKVLKDALIKDLKVPAHKIAIAPNCISKSFLNAARATPKARDRGKMRVGWAGGRTHSRDLALLTDVVKATADKYQWVFVGFCPEGTKDLVEFHEAVDFLDYARKLGELDLDVAVAPLENTRFTSCKSDLRILEFAACGYPIIRSDVTAFDPAPKLACAKTTEDWLRLLAMYESNPFVRENDAQVNHDWLLNERMQENPKNILAWMKAWLPTEATLFNPLEPAIPSANDLPGTAKTVVGGYLYSRKGTKVPDKPMTVGHTFASTSALSNDGSYPVLGKFIKLTTEAETVLPAAAAHFDFGHIDVARAVGPHVFITDAAVARIGLPDTVRYGMWEPALIDWSVRAHRAGFRSTVSVNTYAVAGSAVPQPELMAYAQNEVKAWAPEETFTDLNTVAKASEEKIAAAFRAVDAAAFKIGNVPTTANGKRMLLLNGDSEVSAKLKEAGNVVLQGSLFAHMLTMDPRLFSHHEGFDLRGDGPDELFEVLSRSEITDVVLGGLGNGSTDILGSLAYLQHYGINVVYLPSSVEYICPRLDMTNDLGPCGLDENTIDPDHFCQVCVNRCSSPYGRVNVGAYRASWRMFMEAIAPKLADDAPTV
jgi:hypothetical protein